MMKKGTPPSDSPDMMLRILNLYRESVKKTPLLKFSWVIVAGICVVALGRIFGIGMWDVFLIGLIVIIVSFIAFVLSSLMKPPKDGFHTYLVRFLFAIIVFSLSIVIVYFVFFVIKEYLTPHASDSPDREQSNKPTTDSSVQQPATDTTAHLSALSIDTVINIVTKKENQSAFDLILSNNDDNPASITKAKLVNTFKQERAGFDPFLKTEEYQIWMDSIVPYIVEKGKTADQFTITSFENKDSLGYKGQGSFSSEDSEKRLFYKMELQFPFLLQLPPHSRHRIRLFFIGSRTKLRKWSGANNATMFSTKGKPQVLLNVELSSTDGRLFTYSIPNYQLLETILHTID